MEVKSIQFLEVHATVDVVGGGTTAHRTSNTIVSDRRSNTIGGGGHNHTDSPVSTNVPVPLLTLSTAVRDARALLTALETVRGRRGRVAFPGSARVTGRYSVVVIIVVVIAAPRGRPT